MYASMLWSIQVGVKSVTQKATGEYSDSFSYSGQPIIPCRIIDGPALIAQRYFGQELQLDAVALTRSIDNVLGIKFSLTSGERQQVKVTDNNGTTTLWDALSAYDLGQVGMVRAIALKRWV